MPARNAAGVEPDRVAAAAEPFHRVAVPLVVVIFRHPDIDRAGQLVRLDGVDYRHAGEEFTDDSGENPVLRRRPAVRLVADMLNQQIIPAARLEKAPPGSEESRRARVTLRREGGNLSVRRVYPELRRVPALAGVERRALDRREAHSEVHPDKPLYI